MAHATEAYQAGGFGTGREQRIISKRACGGWTPSAEKPEKRRLTAVLSSRCHRPTGEGTAAMRFFPIQKGRQNIAVKIFPVISVRDDGKHV